MPWTQGFATQKRLPAADDHPWRPKCLVTTQAAGDLHDAEPHLHQAAQAASLLKREVAIIGSLGDPGYSRYRTWLVSLQPAEQARVLRLLVERIDLSLAGMQVRLRIDGLRTLVAEL